MLNALTLGILGASAATVQAADHEGLLQEYCTKCHNFEDYAGGLDLELISPANIREEREAGELIIRRLRAGMMPPAGEPRPEPAVLQAFAETL
jgi:hypothetical protein